MRKESVGESLACLSWGDVVRRSRRGGMDILYYTVPIIHVQ